MRPPHSNPGAKNVRVRRSIEPADWLCDLLQQQGGPDFHKAVLYSFQTRVPADELKIYGLLRLSTRNCVFEQGTLTNWNREANLQRIYYGLPSDCYSLCIEDVHTCVDAVTINHKRSRICGLGGLSKIDRNHPLFIAHWGGDATVGDHQSSAGQVVLRTSAGEQMTAKEFLASCGGEHIASELPVLMMPWPFVYLTTRRCWSTMLVLLRWHKTLHQHRHRRPLGPIPAWPPADAEVWQRCGQHSRPPSEAEAAIDVLPLTADSLERFAGMIRGWAPVLLNHLQAPEQDSQSVQGDLQLVLTTLDKWSFSWRQAMGMVNLAGGGSRFRHDSRKLLDCIRLSFLVNGGPSSLTEVIAQSLSIVLPEFLREPFVRSMCKPTCGKVLPSASLISRYEIALDAALMLLAKKRAAPVCIRVGWTDSSPLAGYDWIWSQYHEIPESKLVRCFSSVRKLSVAISAFVAEHDEQEANDHVPDVLPLLPLPEWKPWLQVISDSIFEHIHPPAALGSGHRSLADKAASEVYKWQLQSPSIAALSQHSASYIAHCSDLGVERSLPDFELSGSVDCLLPEWLRGPMLQPADVDAAPHVMDTDCADDVDGALLNDDDDDDVGRAAGDAAPHAADASEAQAQADKGTTHFMPRAFPVAGMQHIVDNLNSDVHQSMSHWENFHSDLKSLEALLRIDERRQRYVWTCLHGTNLEGQSFKSRKFSASLYEGRWHQIIIFLKHLEPLLPILARSWDKDLYVRGVNANGVGRPAQAQAEQAQQARQCLTALDPAKITVAVQSSLFHAYVAMALQLEEIPEAFLRTRYLHHRLLKLSFKHRPCRPQV